MLWQEHPQTMLGSDSDPRLQPQTLFAEGQEVEVTCDEEGFKGAWFPCTILEPPTTTPTSKKRKKALVQYKSLLCDNGRDFLKEHVEPFYIRPPYPSDKSGDGVFEVNDIVEADYRDAWWIGVIRKVLEGPRYRVYFDSPPEMIDFDAKQLRLHLRWVDGEWVRSEKSQQMVGCSEFSSGIDVEVSLEEGDVRDTWYSAVVVEGNADGTFWVKLETSKDHLHLEKFLVDSAHIRPVPPYLVDRDYQLLEKVDACKEDGGTCWQAGVITKLLAGGQYNVFFKKSNSDKELDWSRLRPHVEWIDGKWICNSRDSHMEKSARNSKRRKRERFHKFIDPRTRDSGIKNTITGDAAKEVAVKDHKTDEVVLPVQMEENSKGKVDKVIAEAPRYVADDGHPSSPGFGGHSLTGLNYVRTTNGGHESREKEQEDNMLDANLRLPFEKRSPVWQTIESIEVFQLVPQKPHFRPLAECKEEFREGTAIGMMVTFASLIEKISLMQIDESRSTYDSTLESLHDLEKHGFDVTLPQKRANELLLIRDGQGELLSVSREAEKQMRDLIHQKRNCDEKVCVIEKKIAELQEELALCKAKMEAKNLEISKLKLHMDAVNGQIDKAQHDYREVATAPWKLP